MPWPALFSHKQPVNQFNPKIASQNDQWHEFTVEEHHWLITSLNRINIFWRESLLRKLRVIFTLICVTMINLATRLTCYTRQRTIIRTTSPLLSAVTAPSITTCQEDLTHPTVSVTDYNSSIDLPSLNSSTMAHMLVQQKSTSLPLHQTTSTSNESILPISHSLDEMFYKPGPTNLFEILQKIASNSQKSKYSPTTNDFRTKILPISEPTVSLNEYSDENISLNCDEILANIPENAQTNQLDTISTVTLTNDFDEDALLNENSSSNVERHFRRRKRHSSLTKTPSGNDENPAIQLDSIVKVDDNNNNLTKPQEEISPLMSIESLSLEEKQQNDQTTTKSLHRFRGRRLRSRSYRQPTSSSQEPISSTLVEFFFPTETPTSTTLPPSPTSPVPNSISSIGGGLKRSGSLNTKKKMVRFADSVGRELAQVQYIQSTLDHENEDKYLFGKDQLYLPKISNYEHKPWSFDIASTSKTLDDNKFPRRFFCLYRQPDSEHPDIYLHEVWKSQIKLEHADIRLKPNSTNEQYLYGTVWVTNAGYMKNVTVKYSFNRWLNTYEYEAQYKCHSNDFRNLDQFEFSIDIPHDVDRIDFVLRYQVNWQEHWDNNEGKNYTIETESASIPHTTISLPHDCDFNEMRFY